MTDGFARRSYEALVHNNGQTVGATKRGVGSPQCGSRRVRRCRSEDFGRGILSEFFVVLVLRTVYAKNPVVKASETKWPNFEGVLLHENTI